MKDLTHRDPIREITLGHPDFIRWRLSLSARDPVFHHRLSEDDLLTIFGQRKTGKIREVMDAFKAKHAQEPEPVDFAKAGESSWQAGLDFHKAVEDYYQWEKHEKDNTNFQHLTTEERYLQFAARNHPYTRARLESVHSLRSIERAALDDMDDDSGFKQWMLEMQKKASGRSADADARRHETLTLTQAFAEYNLMGKVGLAQLRARHDQENEAFLGMPVQEQIEHIRQQTRELKRQIEAGRLDHTDSATLDLDDNIGHKEKLAPTEQTLSQLQINAEADAPIKYEFKNSLEQIKNDLDTPFGKANVADEDREAFLEYCKSVPKERLEKLSLASLSFEFDVRNDPEVLEKAKISSDLAAAERQILEAYPDNAGFYAWMDDQHTQSPNPSHGKSLEERSFSLRMQMLTITERLAEYEARNSDGLAALQARNTERALERLNARDTFYETQKEQTERYNQMLKSGHIQIENVNDPYVVQVKDRQSPAQVHAPSAQVIGNLNLNVPTAASKEENSMTGRLQSLAQKAEQIFDRFTAAVGMAPARRDTARMRDRS